MKQINANGRYFYAQVRAERKIYMSFTPSSTENISDLRAFLHERGMATLVSALSEDELVEISQYTIQKINAYPKHLGKTVENYFPLLYPDEVKSYLCGVVITSTALGRLERKVALNAIESNNNNGVRE